MWATWKELFTIMVTLNACWLPGNWQCWKQKSHKHLMGTMKDQYILTKLNQLFKQLIFAMLSVARRWSNYSRQFANFPFGWQGIANAKRDCWSSNFTSIGSDWFWETDEKDIHCLMFLAKFMKHFFSVFCCLNFVWIFDSGISQEEAEIAKWSTISYGKCYILYIHKAVKYRVYSWLFY